MTLMVKPAATHATGYALLEDGAPIGWLRPGAVGFGGFTSTDDAARAAARAAAELFVWYRERWLGNPMPWLEPIEASGRVECAGTVMGRLLPAHDPSIVPDGYGFELRTPTGLWVGTGEELCQRLVRAMRDGAERTSAPDAAVRETRSANAAG